MPSSDDATTPSNDVHAPVLLQESIAALNIVPAGCYVDATFGRGGHTRAILAALGESGRVIAFDRDPSAVTAAREIIDARLTVVHAPFSQLERVLTELGCAQVDGVLLDLGVSSPQLEQAERGFSFQRDGALDMRMDTSRGVTAADWLASVSEQELREVIKRYGEERFAKQIARAVVAAARRERIRTTGQLAAIVAGAVPTREHGQNPATRTFQAIRIHLNQELEELALVLPQALAMLKPGGRLVVISFHSLEDRLVKRFFQQGSHPALPRRLPLRAAQLPRAQLRLVGKAVRPAAAEVERNPRARSAILRAAEKLAA